MSRILFLATHIGSEYERLHHAMQSDARIDGFKTDMSYDHYDKIETLVSNPHKNNKSNAIWMDVLLHNHNFSCKPLIKICKFVYLMREPRASLIEILSSTGYDQDRAARYYCYRLSGLCEYAIRTGGYVLTHDRLGDLSGLARHLGLKQVPVCEKRAAVSQETPVSLKGEIIESCERSYESHLGHLAQAGLY